MYQLTEKVMSWTEDIDAQTIQQLNNMSRLPIVFKHIAAMPDAHFGRGACVGSVVATKGAIIPSAVGVDIGCGMIAVRTSLTSQDLPDNLQGLYDQITNTVPCGPGGKHQKRREMADAFMERSVYHPKDGTRHPSVQLLDSIDLKDLAHAQLGTLGGGNHFIEVCLDQSDTVWVVLHSGSRGVGNQLAQIHIDVAKGLMREYFIDLPDPDLAYLVQGKPDFQEYVKDLLWCQDYARINREIMMDAVLTVVSTAVGRPKIEEERINCHHNFSEMENHFGENVWVTRKGAIRARPGELGIIPGSMGTKSYIIRGKGHPMSYASCSHGAGRRMSRAEAKRRFTVEDLAAQTEGIVCGKVSGLIDEIPSAYKDIDQVMENQKDLVEILYTLKQVVNVKGIK